MSDNNNATNTSDTTDTTAPTVDQSAEKPVEQWVTGDEPLTGPQASYLATLAREAGEDVPDGLTKAQASEMIDRLQDKTGRGAPADGGMDQPELPLDDPAADPTL